MKDVRIALDNTDKIVDIFCILKSEMNKVGMGDEVECWNLADNIQDAEGAYITNNDQEQIAVVLIKTCHPEDAVMIVASKSKNQEFRLSFEQVRDCL